MFTPDIPELPPNYRTLYTSRCSNQCFQQKICLTARAPAYRVPGAPASNLQGETSNREQPAQQGESIMPYQNINASLPNEDIQDAKRLSPESKDFRRTDLCWCNSCKN